VGTVLRKTIIIAFCGAARWLAVIFHRGPHAEMSLRLLIYTILTGNRVDLFWISKGPYTIHDCYLLVANQLQWKLKRSVYVAGCQYRNIAKLKAQQLSHHNPKFKPNTNQTPSLTLNHTPYRNSH